MNFTVYKSSAGSGKTFTLVKEYLKIALGSEDAREYRKILAITFTNKAAAEMKERVLASLRNFAAEQELTGTSSDLIKILEQELNEPSHVIRERSRKVLASMLHNYSDIGISTIDKFTHRIIRTFAYDLRIPMNFSVETDADELLKKAIDIVIGKVGEDPDLTRALVEFSESKTEDEKNWNVEYDLLRFSRNLLKEDGAKQLEKLRNTSTSDFFEIRNKLFGHIRAFEDRVSHIGQEALNLLAAEQVEHDTFAGGRNGIAKYFTYLAQVKYDSIVPTATVRKYVDEDKWHAGKSSPADKEKIERIKPRLLELYDAALDVVNENLNEITLFNLVNRNIYGLLVLNEIEKAISQMKAEENILHISEFNKRIASIVTNEPAPFIYERLGEKYNHFLIDEFQDTSALQWQNLLPLLDNSLSNGHFNMLVGDGKQAIYRWRGGEVEQFVGLPSVPGEHNDLSKERENTLKRYYKGQVLEKNYRSKAEIVDFNNRFFRYCTSVHESPLVKSVYQDGEQLFDPANTGGGVSIEFINEDPENDLLLDDQMCARTLSLVRQLGQDGYASRDMAVLCRNNGKANILANYLTANGVSIISRESLLLVNSPKVSFMVAFLRYINDPADRIAHAQIIRFLDQADQQNLADYMKERNIRIRLAYLSSLPLYEVCEELIRDSGLGLEADPYLQFFLDVVFRFHIKNNSSLGDFLTWWEEKKESFSVAVPEGMDAVNIMTIHRSKGLEFPVVIFAYANWQPGPKDNIWVDVDTPRVPALKAALIPLDKSIENTDYAGRLEEENEKITVDNLNLLYVACTRPRERLYILTDPPRGQKKLSEYYAGYLKSTGEWDTGKTTYTFGTFQARERKKHTEAENTISISSFISSAWQQKLEISAESSKVWNIESNRDQKQYGNLLHLALSGIRTVEDIEPALFSMVEKGMITPEEQEILRKKINALLAKAEIAPFFTAGLNLKIESDILTPAGSTYRPDRVIIRDKQAILLDYKTGKEQAGHKKQLNEYAAVLNQMGYVVTEKYLLYTEESKLEKID